MVRHYLGVAELSNLWLFLIQFSPYMCNTWKKNPVSLNSKQDGHFFKKLKFIDVMWGKNVFSILESGVHATYSNTIT